MCCISLLQTRNTCTQQPLARFPNLFSVITVSYITRKYADSLQI